MATPYEELYERALFKVKDLKLGSMDESERRYVLKRYLDNFAKASSIYCTYTKEPFHEMRRAEVAATREELMDDLTESPDYQADALRNGNPQPMVFTRGGEDHGYNVICLPGDELYAGDIIDAFGEKWIVMRARADTTTHRVGVMCQCNKLLRFQNFDGTIHERWSYIDVSG